MERDWLAASVKSDVASLPRIVADDFMGESKDGTLLNKDDVIRRRRRLSGRVPTDSNVHVFADTAVLMSYLKMADGGELVWVTHVYQKRARRAAHFKLFKYS